jgi:hypothetical protein
VTLEQADFTQLDTLPKPVALQVRLFQAKDRKVWFVGTRKNLKKWGKEDDPFTEFAPLGSPRFVKLAVEAAASFCKAFDALHAFAVNALPDSQFTGFGPSSRVGELSLGLQMATLLGVRVLSFIDDDDPDEAVFAVVCEPGRVVRARCEKLGVHLLFEGGVTTVAPITKRGDPWASGLTFPGASPVDLAPLMGRLLAIPGVRAGEQPADYFGWSKQLVSQELNAFVGAEIAEPDTVVPGYASMRVVAQRTAGGKVKLM